MAFSFKDLTRLLNGVSLIAKEILKHSEAVKAARNGDLIKKSIVSVTDVSGLTNGSVREFSGPRGVARPRESVVFFGDSEPAATHSQANPPVQASATAEAVPKVDVEPPFVPEARSVGANEGFDSSSSSSSSMGSSHSHKHHTDQTIYSSSEILENRDPRVLEESGELRASNNPESYNPANTAEPEEIPVPRPGRRRPRERRVPSTSFSRAMGFAGLGAGLAWGTLQESARRLVYGPPKSQDKQSALSPFLSEKNAERLALALCRMRGAALKLGQMLSIQDETLVPAPM